VFAGVRLTDVLEDAGVSGQAVEVLACGAVRARSPPAPPSPSSAACRCHAALRAGVLLARDERRAACEHGYPLRLVVRGWYGVASVKWRSDWSCCAPLPGVVPAHGARLTGGPGFRAGTEVGPMRACAR
jgi:DMSO/TMAO reductase YedYZ molybdopterin-dependent catalytic subunit